MPDPIVRTEALKPVSRDHHHTLLLCWKIRQGLKHGVELNRIFRYAQWFWKHHLLPHFALEEATIFPILGDNHPLVKQAQAEHRRLNRLFKDKSNMYKSLNFIEEELEKHVRFEERILFNKVQQLASEEELQKVEEAHQIHEEESWDDEFWVIKKA